MRPSNDLSIVAMLGRTSHKMRLLLDRTFHNNNIDLNVEQFVIIRILSKNDGINQQELAAIIERDKTTVARLVSKMEKRNLVLRVSSKTDKREKHIYVTNYGKEVLGELLPLIKQVQHALVKNISKEELETFYGVLNKMSNEILELNKVVDTTKS